MPETTTPGADPNEAHASVDTTHDAPGSSPKAPHERDESAAGATGGKPDPKMRQAAKDEAHGLKDTSRGEASDPAYEKLREK